MAVEDDNADWLRSRIRLLGQGTLHNEVILWLPGRTFTPGSVAKICTACHGSISEV